MPDIRQIVQDAEFRKLPVEEQRKAFAEYDEGFASLPVSEQERGMRELIGGREAASADTFAASATKPQPKSVGGFATNIGRDIVDIGKGVGTMLAHPIDTASDLGKLGLGMSEAIQRRMGLIDYPQSEGEKLAGLAGSGIAEAIKHPLDYAYERPFSAAMNLSGGLGALSKGAQLTGMARTASSLGKLSELSNPITQIPRLVAPVVKPISKLSKEIIGMTTGAGAGAVEEALEGSAAFTKAMRGKITPLEIVDSAKAALSGIRNKRAQEYQAHLANISNPANNLPAANIDLTPIAKKFKDLAAQYNIKGVTNPKTGRIELDTSRVAMGEKGIKDIEGLYEKLNTWGAQPGDRTALGLDILKRQLDDFYSDSSQARGFVAQMRNVVKDTIVKFVPEYGEMTKGYADASRLIKDIESNLMLRKEGMSGRITADQTLRRLTSAMRENFDLRRDLLNTLGTESGKNIAGEVAGFAMSPAIPRGLIGKLGAGSAIYALSPKFWPLLAASSPRIAGEFLKLFGSLQKTAGKIPVNAISNITFQGAQLSNAASPDEVPQ